MQELIIGIGSNLGDRRRNIESAIDQINGRVGKVVRISELIETEPWGFESGNRFLNCALTVADPDLPDDRVPARVREVVGILQEIEAGFGRVRTGVYTDRAIDLDILFYGDMIIREPDLTVPHPRLHERDFILISLMEICPDRVHPVLGKTIRELYLH